VTFTPLTRITATDLNTYDGSWAHAAASSVGTTGVNILDQQIVSPFSIGGLLTVFARARLTGSAAGARPGIILTINDNSLGELRRDEASPTVDSAGATESLFAMCKFPIAAGETLRARVTVINRSATGTVSVSAGDVTVGAANANYTDAILRAGRVAL
jgi:hypothetical protein